MSICLFVCLFLKHISGSSYTVDNAPNAAQVPCSPEMKPALVAVGSATVAVLSQSSSIERPFFAMRRGHVVYNNCPLYMLLYKQQCRGFYYVYCVSVQFCFESFHCLQERTTTPPPQPQLLLGETATPAEQPAPQQELAAVCLLCVCVAPSLSLCVCVCVETSSTCLGIVLPLRTTLWLTEPIEPLVLQSVCVSVAMEVV